MTAFFDIETTGLNPFVDELITIQFKRNGIESIWRVWESSENQILWKFLAFLDSFPNSEVIVGYNILAFDLPFIYARLTERGMMSQKTFRILYRKNWFDLYQYFGAGYRGVDYWLGKFGIARKCSYTGKDIPILFRNRDHTNIEAHAVEDLDLCEQLFVRASEARGY